VALELGGNAAVIVDKGIDVNHAVNRIQWGAFYVNGQSCISVQRIYVHSGIFREFLQKLKEKTESIVMGNPYEDNTFLGPLIHENEAIRIEKWVQDALKDGAQCVTGGKRNGAFYEPTILVNVKLTSQVSCQEVFGPVCLVEKFDDFESAVGEVNNSQYGLQTGVFTNDINKAFFAFQNLDVGGVVINDVPSVRVDSMPYGGVKDSGLGREGVVFAMEDMSELKVMVMKDIGLKSNL